MQQIFTNFLKFSKKNIKGIDNIYRDVYNKYKFMEGLVNGWKRTNLRTIKKNGSG